MIEPVGAENWPYSLRGTLLARDHRTTITSTDYTQFLHDYFVEQRAIGHVSLIDLAERAFNRTIAGIVLVLGVMVPVALYGVWSWQALAGYIAVPIAIVAWIVGERIIARFSTDAMMDRIVVAHIEEIGGKIQSGEIVVPLGEVRFMVSSDAVTAEWGSDSRTIRWDEDPKVMRTAEAILMTRRRPGQGKFRRMLERFIPETLDLDHSIMVPIELIEPERAD